MIFGLLGLAHLAQNDVLQFHTFPWEYSYWKFLWMIHSFEDFTWVLSQVYFSTFSISWTEMRELLYLNWWTYVHQTTKCNLQMCPNVAFFLTFKCLLILLMSLVFLIPENLHHPLLFSGQCTLSLV
jgi:hypothetical protein